MLFSAGAAALGKGGLKAIRLVVRQLAKGNIKRAILFLRKLARNYRLNPTLNSGANPSAIKRVAPKGYKKQKSVKILVKGGKPNETVEIEWFYSSRKKEYIFANGSTKKSQKDILRGQFHRLFEHDARQKVVQGLWKATDDWIAHHLIPLEAMEEEVVQKAIRYRKKRFHPNLEENGMVLKRTGAYPTHTDRHKAYNDAIKLFLRKWHQDNMDATPQKCRELLDNLMLHLRQKIDASPPLILKT